MLHDRVSALYLALQLLHADYAANEFDVLLCQEVLVFSLRVFDQQADRVLPGVQQGMRERNSDRFVIFLR